MPDEKSEKFGSEGKRKSEIREKKLQGSFQPFEDISLLIEQPENFIGIGVCLFHFIQGIGIYVNY